MRTSYWMCYYVRVDWIIPLGWCFLNLGYLIALTETGLLDHLPFLIPLLSFFKIGIKDLDQGFLNLFYGLVHLTLVSQSRMVFLTYAFPLLFPSKHSHWISWEQRHICCYCYHIHFFIETSHSWHLQVSSCEWSKWWTQQQSLQRKRWNRLLGIGPLMRLYPVYVPKMHATT